ncbi:MAG: two-component regulator propeller domain-containing protein, partial [Mucilaginibacter sp.]
MINLRTGLYIITAFIITSCTNLSNKNNTNQPPAFKQPVIQPLKFSKTKKINWDAIVTAHVQPLFHNLDFNKLPTETYDTTDFKPFSKPVEQAALNFKALPGKNLDIDLLPAKPLKFKMYILPPPKLLKRGPLARVNSSQLIYDFGDIPGPQGNAVSCLYKDHDGFLWFATFQGGLFRYDGENLQQYLPGPLDYSIDGILQDNQGQIWISEFGGGISVLDIKNGVIKKTGVEQGLSSNKPNRMMIDNEQRIWVTYSTGGVDILDTQLSIVKFLGKENGLSTAQATVAALEDGNGTIWISTLGGGLNIIDPVNKKIKYLDKAHGLKSDSVAWLVNDRANHVWMASADGAVNVFGVADNSVQTVREAQLSKTIPTSMFVSDDGKVWCGTNNGLYILDLNKRLVRTIKRHDGLSGGFIQWMDKDNNGHIWIATNSGLNAINVRKTVSERIGNAMTASVFEDKNGLIWQGTNTGVYIINRKNKTIKHLSKLRGLYNDTVQTIKEIKGEVFICSNNGLDIIDSARTSVAHFGTEEGFSNRQILSAGADKKNRLWIGGDQDGLDVLDLNDLSLKHIGKARGLSNGQNIDDIKVDKHGHIWVSTRIGGVNVIDPDKWTIQSINTVNGVKMLQADDDGNMWIGTAKGILIADKKDNKLISFSTPQGLIDERVISLMSRNGKMYAGTNKGFSEITSPAGGVSGDGWKVRSFG